MLFANSLPCDRDHLPDRTWTIAMILREADCTVYNAVGFQSPDLHNACSFWFLLSSLSGNQELCKTHLMDTLTEFSVTSIIPDSKLTGTSPGIWFMVLGLLLLTWDDSRNINIEPGVDQSRSQVIVIHRLHKIFYCHNIQNKSQSITQSVSSYSFFSRRGPRSPGSPVTRRSLLSSAGGWLSCDIICGGSAPCDQGAETGHRRLLMPVTVLKLKQRHFYASDQWSFQFCPSRRWGKLLDY